MRLPTNIHRYLKKKGVRKLDSDFPKGFYEKQHDRVAVFLAEKGPIWELKWEAEEHYLIAQRMRKISADYMKKSKDLHKDVRRLIARRTRARLAERKAVR